MVKYVRNVHHLGVIHLQFIVLDFYELNKNMTKVIFEEIRMQYRVMHVPDFRTDINKKQVTW